MPIYAYKCDSCGFAKDVLQKISDPPLTDCPACNAVAFRKQLTAAGFQLKGSGWYVTDFRDGTKGAAAKSDEKSADSSAGKSETSTDAGSGKGESKSETKTDAKSDAKPATKSESKPAAAPASSKPTTTPSSGSSS